MDWGINKILTITVDYASLNDGLIKFVTRKTKERKTTIFEHKYLHVRCAHILNLIVSDGLKDVHASIMTVWTVMKYVRSSPSRMLAFRNAWHFKKITTCTQKSTNSRAQVTTAVPKN